MKKTILSVTILIFILTLSACGNQTEKGDYIPGLYYAVDEQSQIMIAISVDQNGLIDDVVFDQYYGNTTMQLLADDFELPSGNTWQDEANYISSYLIINQGWGDVEFDIESIDGLNSVSVMDSFVSIDYDNSPEGISFVTLPIDGFVLAWNEAIKDASESEVGLITGLPTSAQWAEANKPPHEYRDGIYYAHQPEHGYFIRLVIEHGRITDVTFDAITAVNTRVITDDNGTPNDPTDDKHTVDIISMTTKLSMYDQLVILSGVAWYTEAEKLREAIIDKQAWDPNWELYIEGTHEYFDMTDPYTVDAVAGVTIGVEGFRATFEDALSQAIIE